MLEWLEAKYRFAVQFIGTPEMFRPYVSATKSFGPGVELFMVML